MDKDTIEIEDYDKLSPKDREQYVFCPECYSFHHKDSDILREHATAFHIKNSEGI